MSLSAVRTWVRYRRWRRSYEAYKSCVDCEAVLLLPSAADWSVNGAWCCQSCATRRMGAC